MTALSPPRLAARAAAHQVVTVAGASVVLMGENTGRSKFVFQAPQTAGLYFNVSGLDAHPTTPGTLFLRPGETVTSDEFCSQSAISVYADTDGLVVNAIEG